MDLYLAISIDPYPANKVDSLLPQQLASNCPVINGELVRDSETLPMHSDVPIRASVVDPDPFETLPTFYHRPKRYRTNSVEVGRARSAVIQGCLGSHFSFINRNYQTLVYDRHLSWGLHSCGPITVPCSNLPQLWRIATIEKTQRRSYKWLRAVFAWIKT